MIGKEIMEIRYPQEGYVFIVEFERYDGKITDVEGVGEIGSWTREKDGKSGFKKETEDQHERLFSRFYELMDESLGLVERLEGADIELEAMKAEKIRKQKERTQLFEGG